MAVLFTNNATSLLASGISDTDLSLSLQAGDGARFPAPTGSDYFYLTITDDVDNEIVKVTARSGDTCTIVRGVDGTTAQAWLSNAKVQLRINKAMLDDALKWDFTTDENPNFMLDISGASLSATPSESGGSIGAGTYYYVINATRGLGFTVKSAEASATISGSTGSIGLSWTHVPGAITYNIYRSTTSGSFSTPAFIVTTSSNNFTDTLLSPASGTPLASDSQTLAPGAAYISDGFDNSASTLGYSSLFIDSIASQSANSSASSAAITLTSQTPANNSYNQGLRQGIAMRVQQAGSGTNTGITGLLLQSVQSGSGSSLGNSIAINCIAQYTGANTVTVSTVTGVLSQAINSSLGTVTNIRGGQLAATVSGDAKATTMYGGDFSSNNAGTRKATTIHGINVLSRTSGAGGADNVYGITASAENTSTGPTASIVAARLYASNNSSGLAASVVGIDASATQYGNDPCDTITSGQMFASNRGTGTVQTLRGSYSNASNIGAASVVNGWGLSCSYANESSGVTTYGKGFEAICNTVGGEITNSYGSISKIIFQSSSTGSTATGSTSSVEFYNTSTNTGYATGGVSQVLVDSSSMNMPSAYGADNKVIISSAGTIQAACGTLVQVQKGSGAITTARGVYVSNVEGETAYGIVVGGITGTTVFGVYQEQSAVPNFFAGNVGIGTTVPTAALDINSDVVRLRAAKTPASATATGNAGDICWDANYLYVCVSASQWKRAALATW